MSQLFLTPTLLLQVRLKTAEAEATIRDLRARIQELEEEQKKMREATPDHSVAHLQEELIAVRLREAEANLALKDLRHRVQELTQLWTKHVQVSGGHLSRCVQLRVKFALFGYLYSLIKLEEVTDK